eukprot:scaffold89751_cov41-Prasinocladus_malaysianus.AAC.1
MGYYRLTVESTFLNAAAGVDSIAAAMLCLCCYAVDSHTPSVCPPDSCLFIALELLLWPKSSAKLIPISEEADNPPQASFSLSHTESSISLSHIKSFNSGGAVA